MSDDTSGPGEPIDTMTYSGYEQWEYRPIVYPLNEKQPWIFLDECFYHASEALVDAVVAKRLFEDIHGVAAIFAFRHYLELSLKRIIASGRRLLTPDVKAPEEDAAGVPREHSLKSLWELVLSDAKPKIAPDAWDSFDIPFVKRCIDELDAKDPRSTAFRYACEHYIYDFRWLQQAMRHVRGVLIRIGACLDAGYDAISEYEAELRCYADD